MWWLDWETSLVRAHCTINRKNGIFFFYFNDLRLLKRACGISKRSSWYLMRTDADGADIAHYRRSLRWLKMLVQRAKCLIILFISRIYIRYRFWAEVGLNRSMPDTEETIPKLNSHSCKIFLSFVAHFKCIWAKKKFKPDVIWQMLV